MRFSALAACSAVIAMATAVATSASAEAVADFYKGKTVNIYIGFGPGGGYDVYTRMLARHFSRFIPGNPTIVPQNMPGAGGVKSATFLFTRGTARWHRPRDVRRLQWARAALRQCSGNFDHSEVHLDRQHEPRRFGLRGVEHRRLQDFSDIMHREMVFGSSGKASTTSQHALVLKNMLGAKVKVIEGYQGTNSINLGMKRREVDASCGIFLSSALTSLRAGSQERKHAHFNPVWPPERALFRRRRESLRSV